MGFCACVYVRVETSLRMCVFVEVEGVCGCLCVMRPPKPPTGGQAVTAQLIVVSIWAAGKGSTMMVASALALPCGQWQPACWLTHFNYDGSQRAGFAISTMAASVLAYPLQLGW